MVKKPRIRPRVAAICRDVKRRREELGLTQDELAERAGLSPYYIGGVELGRCDPTLLTLQVIAEALSMEPGCLFGARPSLSEEAREMAVLFDGAPAMMQRAVQRVLRVTARRMRAAQAEQRPLIEPAPR